MKRSEKDVVAFLQELANAADAIALQFFRSKLPVDVKDDRSPVTEADRQIELKLRDMIRARYPEDGIIGEEFGPDNPDAQFVWVIDPIDGTRSFITGRPLFGTIIGLLENGQPLFGLVSQAYTRERWIGRHHSWATHNGAPIHVAAPRQLKDARLYTGSVGMFDDGKIDIFLSLARAASTVEYYCDCYAYALLAMGWVDAVVEQQLKIYDVAGLVPIITGAGGVIGDWSLQSVSSTDWSGQVIAASHAKLADQLKSLCAASSATCDPHRYG